jgi:nicotinate-nucleotide--dimethylbenzimidazole phosphoribosyltransferase
VSDVPAPAILPDPPVGLGRLGVALSWLARTQGSWPPRRPRSRRDLELVEGSGLTDGRAEADGLADAGVDLLVLDGPAPSAAALTALAAMLDVEPVLAVGTRNGPGWAALVVAVRDGLPAARAALVEPERLVADPLLGRAAGLLAQCAVRRTPVILGPSVTLAAAALGAERLAPGARRWWFAACEPPSQAARLAYAELALDPVLDLGLTVPGGAALALDVLTGGIDIAERLHNRGAEDV